MAKMQHSISGFINRKRGYVLSLDAMFSIILLIALIGIMSYSLFMESKNPYASLEMQKSMNDSMDLLDAQKILQQFDSTAITNAINAVLPLQYSWKMRIEKYSYANDDFTKRDEIYFGAINENLSNKDIVHGRRLFLTFANNEISYYYNTEYWVWVKE